VFDETYSKIKEEFKSEIEFVEYEQDADKEMFKKYFIDRIPTLIYIRGHEELIRHIRPESYETIKTFIEKNLFSKEEEEKDKK
jgi:hypothetical protein